MTRSVAAPGGAKRTRVQIGIEGRVQGVGLRPFVARLADAGGLSGWIRNEPAGVRIEVEGDPDALDCFMEKLKQGTPVSGELHLSMARIKALGESAFAIRESNVEGARSVSLPPDLAVCAECLRELRDPANPRFRYPFITCVHCGPRASIITSLPYDRERTTMAKFEMCARCRSEYASRDDRRFHAEAIACPDCGPQLEWRTASGERVHSHQAILRASQVLLPGGIIAAKGISGFHLMTDATNEDAVRRLRAIKRRDAKPFAVMYPDCVRLELSAKVTATDRTALESIHAPIVLVERRAESDLAPSVAMHNPFIGAMLAYAPLHHLLLESVGRPLVATSANLGEEPILTDNARVIEIFGAQVDGVLMHNRGIARAADDSVVRVMDGIVRPLRIARGFAPLRMLVPAHLKIDPDRRVLAMGGHEKASIALAHGGSVVLGRHLGDLDSLASREAYEHALRDFLRLHDFHPGVIVCDLHPDYFSTRLGQRLAGEFGCGIVRVQHHAAHLHSLLLESEDVAHDAAGLCFDGTGLGSDGSVWGAEWIMTDESADVGWRRIATMHPIPLAGGEASVREPWRVALALAHEAGLAMRDLHLRPDRATSTPDSTHRRIVESLISRNRSCVPGSSMGRLFDGVASILNLRHYAQFSAQPAMEFEFMAGAERAHRGYPVPIGSSNGLLSLDWRPMVREIISDLGRGVGVPAISAAFHCSIARAGACLARRLRIQTVLLTGGCFQNRMLAECTAEAMQSEGVSVRTHTLLPSNDGGLAAGQALAGARIRADRKKD